MFVLVFGTKKGLVCSGGSAGRFELFMLKR